MEQIKKKLASLKQERDDAVDKAEEAERERKEGEEGGREEKREGEGRSTYGDTVVAGEPDSYKQPNEEAKSCWGRRGWVHHTGVGRGGR